MRKTMALVAAVTGLALAAPAALAANTPKDYSWPSTAMGGAQHHSVGPGRPGRGACPRSPAQRHAGAECTTR